jgi:ABC-type Na+ transport system ATPase subunit NatA
LRSLRADTRIEMLEINHLRKSFGPVVAVDDVSFCVTRGELLGLLGPNGAGKTTTVSMIGGLLPPDRGRVLVDGKPLPALLRRVFSLAGAALDRSKSCRLTSSSKIRACTQPCCVPS